MPNVCYFEIPVEEMARAQAFYKDLFQWKFTKMEGSPAECDYWSIETGTPDQPGTSYGGMMKKQDPMHRVTQYISVDSVDTSLQKAEQLGAMVIMPKTPVPGKGYFAICLDPEKNPFGLWQCDESAA